jgi:phage baseplate assembly protein W
MSGAFTGKGWKFPVLPDAGGGLGYVAGQENVQQSLRILLLTALGERVMRPTFGCKAPRLVFAPGSVQYLQLLETSVREAVRDWEPRVETRAIVSIAYRIRGSNTRNNLVFPFYLGIAEVAR